MRLTYRTYMHRRTLLLPVLLFVALIFPVLHAWGEETAPPPLSASPPAPAFKWFEPDYELDAYYTNASLAIALTKDPIPSFGERDEGELYRFLLSHSIIPRFLYLEASVNPMPYLGVSVKKHQTSLYEDAELTDSFNIIKSLTAGFEEPWALSLFAGTVVDFDIPGREDTHGKGYSGYLLSAGNYHIKDNTLIKDEWREFEWKVKGDRKSPERKLNWSFRVGAKLHGNPDITDIIYLSIRRSRVDYRSERDSIFNNSGFEYTYDMNRRGLHAIRHYFFIDKKWPDPESRMAFALAVGFVWESADKYSGDLKAGRTSDEFQLILRPNIEF